MNKGLAAIFVCLMLSLLVGCGGGKKEAEEAGELKTTAPVNNNSPEAKNAPVAPHDPSIVYPGGGGGAGKKTGK